jgi:small Trp-rich protein
MWFVGLGVLLILLNLAGIGPFGAWEWPKDWLYMCWPFGLAAAWWLYSDSVGLTQKREMDKMALKKETRRRKAMETLGLQNPKRRRRW